MSIDDLIIRYLNEECSEAEARKLFAWVKRDDENADRFLRDVSLHARLRTHHEQRATPIPKTADIVELPTAPTATASVWRRPALALAAGLAVLFAISSRWTREPATIPVREANPMNGTGKPAALPRHSFARLIHGINARWHGAEPTPNVPLPTRAVKLISGSAQLRFDNRVDVTLNGPTAVEFTGTNGMNLLSGTMTALVPPGAEGFHVHAGNLDVKDLGTFFGIRKLAGIGTDVTVFSGEVEILATATTAAQRVRQGQTAHSGPNQDLTVATATPDSFTAIWQLSLGIAASDRIFAVLPPGAGQSAPHLSDTEVFVLGEDGFRALPVALPVNISSPGSYRKVADPTETMLPAGTIVRSHLLLFQPTLDHLPRDGRSFEFLRVQGEITFTDPIAGIAIMEDELRAGERILPNPTVPRSGNRYRSIELSDSQFGDEIHLSRDRRTLRLSLRATSGFSDHIRVFTSPRD